MYVWVIRDVIFASYKQLELLGQAKNWYIRGTFHVVRRLFTQLLSIHAFVKSGSKVKQVLLLFTMSGQKKKDYKAVFKAVKCLLPASNLKTVPIDFETAKWKASCSVFPDVSIFECVFHWVPSSLALYPATGLLNCIRQGQEHVQIPTQADGSSLCTFWVHPCSFRPALLGCYSDSPAEGLWLNRKPMDLEWRLADNCMVSFHAKHPYEQWREGVE